MEADWRPAKISCTPLKLFNSNSFCVDTHYMLALIVLNIQEGIRYLGYLDDVLDHGGSSLEVKLYAQDFQRDGVGHSVEPCDHLHYVGRCGA